MYYPPRPIARKFHQKRFLTPLKKEIGFIAEPLEVYKRIYYSRKDRSLSFILDSARHDSKIGRFSFIGDEPFLIFRAKGYNVQVTKNGRKQNIKGNPVKILRSLLNEYNSPKMAQINYFTGGAVGYFSYDCCHFFEKLPDKAEDDLNLADMFFIFVDTVCVFDHFENKTSIVSNIYPDKPFDKAYSEAVDRIERFEDMICRGGPLCPPITGQAQGPAPTSYQSNFTKQGFEDIVKKAKAYIAAGDIYQANLSQRFSFDVEPESALSIYEHLSNINPSPFACFLDFGELKIASSSPERLVKLENGFAQTRPIAGTRPRGKGLNEDLALSCELVLSDKERAEHIMLVDLERNDLGRVCEYNSIKVDELMTVESYSHVMHIVSNVTGKMKPGKDRFDLLAAGFPGGTITGCPKIRCMQIIDELEPVKRNIYTGSIGYLGFNNDMDLNIAIRTFVINKNKAYIQVGAGIVADSDPDREYYETLYKAEALFEALKTINEKAYSL